MAVERAAGGSSLIDVLDRVLDKGIVIDAWVRVSLVGIDLITVEARVVVASIDTYLKYAEAIGASSAVARPTIETQRPAHASARNHLAARVVAITSEGPLERVSLDCGFPLDALITRQSRQALQLAAGSAVTAAIKAASVHLVARGW